MSTEVGEKWIKSYSEVNENNLADAKLNLKLRQSLCDSAERTYREHQRGVNDITMKIESYERRHGLLEKEKDEIIGC